jgi:N-acetylglucosaminyl-diphospho-decaprenol L-rhamnosyltransferase
MVDLDIAVVIVTYKCAEFTIDSIRSLQSERTIAGIKLRAIVVDNASGDLPAIAEAVRINDWSTWVTLVAAPKNGGFAYGNNFGIGRAFAAGVPSYIYLLNPDAQVRPNAIQALVRFMEARPDVGIVGSGFENLDGSDWPIAFRFPTLTSELIEGLEFGIVTRMLHRWVVPLQMTKMPQRVDWICGASMLIRPQVFSEIGGLDENYFLYFEETDFCNRAKQAGYPTWYLPESRVMHIGGAATKVTDLTGGPKRMPAYWFASRRRYFAVTFGLAQAIAIDIVAVLAHALGSVKRVALLRKQKGIPHFIRDLITHSIIWPKNRDFPAVRYSAIEARSEGQAQGNPAQ